MLVLGRADLRRLLRPLEVVEALAPAFASYAAGRWTVPARAHVPAGEDGVLLVMPAAEAASDGAGALGAKLVTVYPSNRAHGRPTIYASYLLLDAATGEPLALLEGEALTGMRTAAVSALAARYLARADSRRLTCFGAGAQAAFQLRALTAVLAIERVDVVGRDPERAARFAASMSAELGVPVVVARDTRAALATADVVTCATTSTTPIVRGAELRPGTHVDAVGAFRPTDRELDTEAIARARVVVDTYAGALTEAGDLVIPLAQGAVSRAHVAAELAELVAGTRPGRRQEHEVTVFKSVGFALEDLAAARLAYNRAMAEGAGTRVTL